MSWPSEKSFTDMGVLNTRRIRIFTGGLQEGYKTLQSLIAALWR